MPLYEYDCKSCERTVEVLVRSDSEPIACPECGETEIERVLSVPASPSVKGSSALPMAASGPACGAPRCCGGGCQI